MSISTTQFKGSPSTRWSADYVDYLLWLAGIRRHLLDGKRNGDERSFLRGLHHYPSLGLLSNFLRTHIPNAYVSLQSVWVDKHPQAHFYANKSCEIGDLLVITHITTVANSSNTHHTVGWVLQGKTAVDPASVKHYDTSTRKEVTLYQKHLAFQLKHGSLDLGRYDLALDQDVASGSADNKWEFLQFCKNDTEYNNTNWPPSPIQRLWPLGIPLSARGSNSSFAAALLKIAQSDSTTPSSHGAVLARNPQWASMCKRLLSFTAFRVSRLARGPWQLNYPHWLLYPSYMLAKTPPPISSRGLALTTDWSHNFSSDRAAKRFKTNFIENIDDPIQFDSWEDYPDFLDLIWSDADEGDGGMSTLVINVVRRNDEKRDKQSISPTRHKR